MKRTVRCMRSGSTHVSFAPRASAARCCSSVRSTRAAVVMASPSSMAALVATDLGCRPEQVLVASTGVIGRPLPMAVLEAAGSVLNWTARQVYIALGFLLLGAAEIGVDACPIEGFDCKAVDAELGLEAKGLTSVVVVALGHKSAADFNAALPKSRLAEAVVITEL